ncbi:extensin family protein [Sphingomonas jatrophae]|uniref:Uncharacterized conserved protein n=1 Tax=Sphingomonas jatrophae TaxID=1166337 RepID=A0A1I6LBU7_9SPHN|nr:extensin family protein [Sphingomonas jatrophae]SFS00961.1 Uncharacterized conserved protein [Sphingomonas jatrophae]
MLRLLLLLILAGAGWFGWTLYQAREREGALDLGAPPGLLDGRRLTGLTGDFRGCRAALERAGVRYTALAPVRAGHCGYADGVRLSGGAATVKLAPASLGTSCAVAASLARWTWDAVQPAAVRHFGTTVVSIETFGSYSCRRLYGRREGGWSEHSTADAIDIAGFRLADGRRITVAGDWRGEDAAARFLHDVRDGACRLFATTLSPDYNAAHRDHLHLDQAARGTAGWRACR